MNNYKGFAWKKCIRPHNYMSAVVEISFFRPKNVGFLNSKLRWVADVNRTINWLQPNIGTLKSFVRYQLTQFKKGLPKKNVGYLSFNYMDMTAVKIFFRNVGFFNSRLEQVADANWTIVCCLKVYIYFNPIPIWINNDRFFANPINWMKNKQLFLFHYNYSIL